jgi:inorganic triphosphatase YgiF
MMSPLHLEIEAKLAIVSETPRDIALAIGRLGSLGEWSLRERRPVTVRDTYFDLADDALGRQGLAFRLRRSLEGSLITIKGPETEVGGILERRELEDPWSDVALESALAYLASYGVHLTVPDPVSSDDDPEHVLRATGLVPTQDRTTSRVRREVITEAERGGSLAEVAIDEVVFRLGSRTVGHYEAEIELEEAGDDTTVGSVRAELQKQWDDLRPWPYSKYATGRAIATLLAQLDVAEVMGPGGVLAPRSYNAIEELLRRQG